jgi:hypothetical protein
MVRIRGLNNWFSEFVSNYITWKDNLVAFAAERNYSEVLSARYVHGKQAIATWQVEVSQHWTED